MFAPLPERLRKWTFSSGVFNITIIVIVPLNSLFQSVIFATVDMNTFVFSNSLLTTMKKQQIIFAVPSGSEE